MIAFGRMKARAIHSTLLLLLASSIAGATTVTVTPTVTHVGSLYKYAYSIVNDTPDDSFLIDIPVPKDPDAVLDLTAPAGFETAFDSGLGLVSFLENTSMFGSTPAAGFSFESPDAPGAVDFDATLLSSSSGSLYTLAGPTVAPVPEPAQALPVVLFAALCLVLGTTKKKEKKQLYV